MDQLDPCCGGKTAQEIQEPGEQGIEAGDRGTWRGDRTRWRGAPPAPPVPNPGSPLVPEGTVLTETDRARDAGPDSVSRSAVTTRTSASRASSWRIRPLSSPVPHGVPVGSRSMFTAVSPCRRTSRREGMANGGSRADDSWWGSRGRRSFRHGAVEPRLGHEATVQTMDDSFHPPTQGFGGRAPAAVDTFPVRVRGRGPPSSP